MIFSNRVKYRHSTPTGKHTLYLKKKNDATEYGSHHVPYYCKRESGGITHNFSCMIEVDGSTTISLRYKHNAPNDNVCVVGNYDGRTGSRITGVRLGDYIKD
jgi:hypothetical protein